MVVAGRERGKRSRVTEGIGERGLESTGFIHDDMHVGIPDDVIGRIKQILKDE